MRRLYRSTHDRKIFGVCGGLAEYIGVDSTLLRILLVIVTVFSGGSVIPVYIIAGFIIPREPGFGGGYGANPYGPGGYAPGGPSWNAPGWNPPPQQGPGPAAWQSGGPWPPGGGAGNPAGPRQGPSQTGAAASSTHGLDAMMEDIEKKALKQEIEELKARIAKFENQSKGE